MIMLNFTFPIFTSLLCFIFVLNYVSAWEEEEIDDQELDLEAEADLSMDHESYRPKRDAEAKPRGRGGRFGGRYRSSSSTSYVYRRRSHSSHGGVSKETSDLVISTCGAMIPLFGRFF